MPELPEAETIARGLQATLPGRSIESVQVLRPDILTTAPDAFRACVRGRRFERVERRGKKVVLVLDQDRVLIVNLGMTGRLLVLPSRVPPAARPGHPALRFRLEGGGTLVYDDVRRFGSVECLSGAAWMERSGALGPEPLSTEFTPALLAEGLRRSAAPVRSWLLDQRRVAGVGNIYANEALWRARLHPYRPAHSLSRREATRLHRTLREVLGEAVESRGTTLRDYRTAEGEQGGFSPQLSVYGREGSPCPRCRTGVVRIVFGNRSAFLCPRCQREGVSPD
jgi:formamidopyrimidine-DNA glycosylase